MLACFEFKLYHIIFVHLPEGFKWASQTLPTDRFALRKPEGRYVCRLRPRSPLMSLWPENRRVFSPNLSAVLFNPPGSGCRLISIATAPTLATFVPPMLIVAGKIPHLTSRKLLNRRLNTPARQACSAKTLIFLTGRFRVTRSCFPSVIPMLVSV